QDVSVVVRESGIILLLRWGQSRARSATLLGFPTLLLREYRAGYGAALSASGNLSRSRHHRLRFHRARWRWQVSDRTLVCSRPAVPYSRL
ncbi:MAG: hypothetical protein AAFY15_09815, partial [Cyanobacteria bacterium J06648_11]